MLLHALFEMMHTCGVRGSMYGRVGHTDWIYSGQTKMEQPFANTQHRQQKRICEAKHGRMLQGVLRGLHRRHLHRGVRDRVVAVLRYRLPSRV